MKKFVSSLIILISLISCTHIKNIYLKPGFTIYLNDPNSIPVINALEILQRDIKSVLGAEAHIETNFSNMKDVGNSLIIINEKADYNLPIDTLEGFERHKLFTKDGNLILHGSDMRGTIYAIYTFSEKFLGIEPLWFWASHHPEKKGGINILSSFSYDSGEPYVKYRAWFPNDTDMFSPWRKKSPVNNEIWLETMLRLKLNTVETGSSSDYTESYAISDYAELLDRFGLKITYHHVSALNSPFNKWDDYWTQFRNIEPPKLSLSNIKQIEEFWRYNVRCLVKNGIEPIWVINFRGNRDIPFWYTFEDAPESMEERARIINEMVHKQMQILKEETGNEFPVTRMIFYDELSDLLADGLLIPPDEENLIWNFVAARRDHFPNEDIRLLPIPEHVKLGYYMNLQFTSTGSHLAQAEGPWKMEKNYRFVDSKNGEPLCFSVVNAGNLREHLLTLSANADLLWRFESYDSNEFLKDFCAQYFGNRSAELIAGLYRDYFYSYWNQKKNNLEGYDRQYIFHDLRYKQTVMQLSEKFFDPVNLNPLEDYSWEQLPNRTFRIIPEDNGAETQIEAIINGTGEAYKKFKKVAQTADSVYQMFDNQKRVFFDDNLRSVAYFMMYLNESLLNYCHAYISQPGVEQRGYLEKALNAARDARQSIYESAHDQFDTWYSKERIFDIDDYINRIDQTLKLHKLQ